MKKNKYMIINVIFFLHLIFIYNISGFIRMSVIYNPSFKYNILEKHIL